MRRLLRFFGDTPPLDVALEDLEVYGLGLILHSKLPLCYFLRSLLEDYASENLVGVTLLVTFFFFYFFSMCGHTNCSVDDPLNAFSIGLCSFLF
jgi:hypothetical protein